MNRRHPFPVSGGSGAGNLQRRLSVTCLGAFVAFCIGLLSLVGGRPVVIAIHDDHGHSENSPAELAVDLDHHSHGDPVETPDGHEEDHGEPDHHHHIHSSPGFDMMAIHMPDAALFQPVKRYSPVSSDDECPPGPVNELAKPPQRA